jgi:hypothetical protein
MAFGEQSAIFNEDFRFNMGSFYMSIIADIIKSTSVASLNNDISRFHKTTSELLDISMPILVAKKVKIKDLKDDMEEVRVYISGLSKISNETLKAQKTETTFKIINQVRNTILTEMRGFLMPIEKNFTSDGALKETFGLDQ